MDISVVIPSHDRARTLRRALDSVLQQTSPADEIIVIDDGSTDGSDELLRQNYPQITVINQSNHGVSHARNQGIRRATSRWIALLDSDDAWLPCKLERIRQAQQQNPDEILFHSDEIWIRNGVRVNPMHKHAKHGGWIFEQCLPLCVISPSAAVIHRSVFDQVGYFDEDLPACEDYDLWLRLCHRFPVHYLDQPLITKYGGHDDQLSQKYWGMDRFRIRALHKLLQLDTPDDQQRQQAGDMLQKKLRILLNGARKHGNQLVLREFTPLYEQHRARTC